MNNDTINEIKVSADVISSIAEIAIKEFSDVSLPKLHTTKKIFKYNSIETILNEDIVEITIPIIIDYGVSITDISSLIQEKVKENIEIMTNLNVKKVNLSIVGVNVNN